MSAPRDEKAVPDLEAVGKAYREARFDDEPPGHVDAFIRAAAKRESKRSFNSYLPSLAMAATIVLALGLVLRLTIPGRDLLESTRTPEAEQADAPSLQAPAAFEERAAPPEDRAAPPGESVPAPADTLEQSVQERAVQLEAVVTRARQSTAGDDVLERDGAAASVAGRMAAPSQPTVPCAAAERDEPELWLACMAAQIDAGLLDAARAELEQFRLEFADYAVPARIVEALDP